MLTLPPFVHHAPGSLEEALRLLEQHQGDVKVLAGGTDLLPNMKHRLATPGHVVSLRGIPGLGQVTEAGGELRLGALVSIAALARHARVKEWFPALAQAAEQIAGPQLREMGTLGGNLCLDARCVYVNQSYFWRQALGFCLKKDGTVCHVVKGGKNCVAAASSDTAPVLMALGATAHLLGPSGARAVPLADFYVPDGVANTVLLPGELLVEVRLRVPARPVLGGYQKLRIREAIDFPALGVAMAAELDDGRVASLKVVVTALGSRPHAVARLDGLLGRKPDAAWVAELGQLVRKQCHPLTNINVDPAWRRELLPVLVRRLFT